MKIAKWLFMAGLMMTMIVPPLYAEDAPIKLATQEYPPYIVQDGNSAKGLTVDIVKEVFSRMKRNISLEFYPWARALAVLESGQVDGLFTIKRTPERESTMLFPNESLISQDYVFFVLKNSKITFDGDLSKLNEVSIGVVDKTSYGGKFDTAAKNGEFKKLDPASNNEMTFKKLLAGRVDAVICSRLVGIEFLEQLGGLDKVKVAGPPVETLVSYLVFSRKRDNTQLAAAFDKAISSMKKDGTMAKILGKYKSM